MALLASPSVAEEPSIFPLGSPEDMAALITGLGAHQHGGGRCPASYRLGPGHTCHLLEAEIRLESGLLQETVTLSLWG